MNPFGDPRDELIKLIDDYLATDPLKRKAELAALAGVSEMEVQCWQEGKSRPDGVQLRYVLKLLHQRCC
jgi:hypothetical protein